jgi:type I site-specific restriction endonuclease
MSNVFGEVISVYSRAQAIEDGVLVDLSRWSKEMGIRFPVAVTDTVFHTYLNPSKEVAEAQGQDVEGRIWDLLTMFRWSIHNGKAKSEIQFQTRFVMDTRGKQQDITFKALCHGGDNLEPVITIMMPHED